MIRAEPLRVGLSERFDPAGLPRATITSAHSIAMRSTGSCSGVAVRGAYRIAR